MALPTALDIDVALEDFGVVLDEMTSKPALIERDMERLRHALYQRGGMDRQRAARIFHANRIMLAHHDGWSEFYLETLTGFFLECQGDSIILPAMAEEMLLTWLGDGISIDHVNERRLILRILLKTSSIPVLVEQRVLHAVEDNLLNQSERWLGVGERSVGVVDVLDMQLIRRLAHRAGGQYPQRCNRAVISFLIGLDQHAKQFIDQEGWRQLLVDCVARHLRTDALNGCELALASNAELKAGIKILLGEGYAPQKARRLQDEVLAAMRLRVDRDGGIMTALERV